MARLDKTGGLPAAGANDDSDSRLLEVGSYRVSEGGVEFRSEREVGLYTELHLRVVNPDTDQTVRFNGVVVNCVGNRHQGFQISLAFTNISESDRLSLYEMYWAQM